MSKTTLNDMVDGVDPGRIIEDPMDYIDFAARYHGDPDFRNAAVADPVAALRSEGIAVADGVEVRLLSSEEGVLHIVLPPLAAGQESGDDSGGR